MLPAPHSTCSSTYPELRCGRGLRGLSSALPLSVLFSSPDFSLSLGAAGARMHGRAGWVLAGSRVGLPPPCQSTEHKRHLRCVSRYLLQGEVPHSHRGSPGSQRKGSQSSIGGSHTSKHLPKVSAGVFCFPHAPLKRSRAIPLIPAEFAKLCLAKPSSLHLRSLMGTVWMESQHSPRFWEGQRLPCVQPSAVQASLPSPEQGKALKSH